MSLVVRPPLSAATRLCAVYGHPVRHSASPAMQNAGMKALGLDWRYVACEVQPEALGTALAGGAAMRFVGVNLTVPHKLMAMEMMDVLDVSARTWGAVNTVRFEGRIQGGSWEPLSVMAPESVVEVRRHGFNTDADAVVRALREDLGVELRGARVLLLGAGGAGRVTALRCAAEGVAALWLVNRTEDKAHALAREMAALDGSKVTRLEVGYPEGKAEVDVVINATSAGLKPGDPLPYDPLCWEPGRARAAYDLIYRPAETAFLAAAKAAGARTSNGLGMLLYQGAAALEIWSGQAAPVAEMRRALWSQVYGESELGQ
jgi:shikimate dehydrogenase